jgi:GTPase SAR1 family protein
MIGDEYFDLRSRLSRDLLALSELLRELAADAESVAILENLVASLKEPFVFVVVGEVNVGKSTFLNALFGEDFSRTGVMPTTEKILFFKHGPELQVTSITPTLDEVSVPVDFLKDFHIVDTPGTNSIEGEHQQITERFVPIADLVIFVFSAMNPWAASAWQFLERVHHDWMRNVIFVLQQSDLRSPEEIQVITDYMGQLTEQRFGKKFPLFAVSAKKAYLSRSSGHDRERLMAESGFDALERHINQVVDHHPARLAKLASTVALARQMLGTFRGRVEAARKVAMEKSELIRRLDTEREMQADRTLKKMLPALDATERDYEKASRQVCGLADATLSTRKAMQSEEQDEAEEGGHQSLDHRLFQKLLQRAGERWRQMSHVLAEDHQQYYRYLRSEGRAALGIREGEPTDGEGEDEIRRRFVARVESTLRRFVLELKLDESVEPGLKKARLRVRMLPWVLLMVAAGSGAGWWADGPLMAGAAFAAGLLVAAFFFILVQAALNGSRRRLTEKLEESREVLREMLASQIKEDVHLAFEGFSSTLKPASESIGHRLTQMDNAHKRLERMSQVLDERDRELHAAQPRS